MPRLIQKIQASSIQDSEILNRALQAQSQAAAPQDNCHQTLMNPGLQENSCSIPNLSSSESLKLGQHVKVSEWPKNAFNDIGGDPKFESCPNGHDQYGTVMDGFSPPPFSEAGEFKDVIDYDLLGGGGGGGGNSLMDDFLDDSLWSMDKF